MGGNRRPRIAVSVALEEPRSDRLLFKNKPLQYVEEGLILALAGAGALPFLVPDLKDEEDHRLLLEGMEGLVLSGGSDLDPRTYGQEPLDPQWGGDLPRDLYELSLFHEARRRDLPVLGICRGCQLLNVALGGSLWQDIEVQVDSALKHRDPGPYDRLEHEVEILEGSFLAGLLGGGRRKVNSVHHQGLARLAQGLRAVARSPDGMVEAVESETPLLLGIQWHPEWMAEAGKAGGDPILRAFVDRCRGGG